MKICGNKLRMRCVVAILEIDVNANSFLLFYQLNFIFTLYHTIIINYT